MTDASSNTIIRVALDVPLDRTFDYAAPGPLAIGSRVSVGFGPRQMVGIVLGHATHSEFDLKPARPIEDMLPPLPDDWLALVRFAADYYACAPGPALFTALPPALRAPRPFIPARDPQYRLTPAGRDWQPPRRAARQCELHAALAASPLARSSARAIAADAGRRLDDWLAAGWIEEVDDQPAALTLGPLPALTPAQQQALDQLPRDGFSPTLLFGITGSGANTPSRVPILLGSATPSLESWRHADAGRYGRVELAERATGAALPAIHLIDIRRLPLDDGLSVPAIEALARCRDKGEVSLVYLNRRGYSPALSCTDCGWIAGCPSCSAKLVLHLRERQLRCHHCGHHQPVPHACPDCGNPDLKPLGQGTQRVEAALTRVLPGARIRRIDRDTVSHRDAWAEVYQAIHDGEVDVLVGTQMLAKGHDFPTLSLVVALNTDGGLYSADFRASETLFSQLMQVAGRAGRAERPGTVLVQTQLPEHPLYQALCRHDYPGFAATLLDERKQTDMPPYCHQFVVRADSEKLADARAFLGALVAALPAIDGVCVYDPITASMVRLEGRERAQVLVQSAQRGPLRRMLAELTAQAPVLAKPYGRHLRWSVDVDPLEL